MADPVFSTATLLVPEESCELRVAIMLPGHLPTVIGFPGDSPESLEGHRKGELKENCED